MTFRSLTLERSLLQVELVVHPSIQPNDEIVTRAIDQIRFKISSSQSAARWA